MPKSALSGAFARGLGLFAVMFAVPEGGSAAPPLSVYGNLPGFEMASISSSGDHIAVIGMIGDKRQLVVMDKDRKALFVSTIDAAAKVRDLLWAGDAMVLVRTSATVKLGMDFTTEKAELSVMIVVPLADGKAWTVFANNPLIRGGIRGFYGVNQRDGKYYGYFGGITLEGERGAQRLASTKPVLYEVDLQTHATKAIARRTDGDDSDRTWLVDANGSPSVTMDFSSKDGAWRITNADRVRIASGVQKFGDIDLVSFGSSPGTLVYSETDSDTGSEHWNEVPTAGGDPKEIAADDNIRGALLDRRTRRLIGYQLEGDRPAYKMFDPYQAKVVAATQKAFPDHGVRLIEWNEAFDRLIVQTDGPGDPQTWWLVDIKTGSADILGTSYPMPGKDVGAVRMVSYKAGDGTAISAVLTLPPGREARKLPVVVLPHGGPAARDYPEFDWWAQALAAQGYAVLQPNFRGSTGYGASFQRAGNGEWGRKMQSDISDGLTELVKEGIADPKRACIVGASYGGYAALAGVTLQQGLYRCAVAFGGVSDVAKLVAAKTSATNGDQTLIRSLKQDIGSGHDLTMVSPIRFAARADAPILLIHGKDDTVVDYGQSSDMAAALRHANKPVEFVTLPQSDHWLSSSETRLAMLQATVAFVEKYNPPDTPGQ